MRKGVSLQIKLILSFLVLAALVGGVGVYQVLSINRLSTIFSDLTIDDAERLAKLENIRITLRKMESESLRYHLGAVEGGSSGISTEQIRPQLINHEETIQQELTSYEQLLKGQTEAASVNVAELRSYSQEMVQLAIKLVDDVHTPNGHDQLQDKQDKLNQTLDGAISVEQQNIRGEREEANKAITDLTTTVIILVASVGGFSIILGLLVAGRITQALSRIKMGAERIANGDFSNAIAVTTHDEIGELGATFNQMADRLRDSYRRIALESQRDEILLESMGEGLIALDAKANIVLVNNKAVEMLELEDRQKLMGKTIHDVFVIQTQDYKPLPDDQRPSHMTLTTSKASTGIYGLTKKEGKKILISVSANPIVLDGQVSGVIMIIRDVTKEREVDRMKTEFISLASHQLRTPLSAIKWFTEMLLNGDAGKMSDEQVDFAKNIQDSTERMIELVNSLLNISRIESGRIIVDPKPTDLNVLVGGIVNDLKAKIEDRKQNLVVSVHKDLPKINLDPRLIGQVYLNFLTNALKYTPKGGEITVFISRKGEDVVSQISDNGYGIPKTEQAKVFQKFFRADNVAKFETDGTGLGLYLVKAIIESSGGKVWFKSEEGKGTTFWFSLPLSGMKAKAGEVTLDI